MSLEERLLSKCEFSEGDRVYLGGDHGEEPHGRISDLVVSGYVISVDDGEEIRISISDPGLVPASTGKESDG